jgi:hypothetical protein
MPGWPISSWVPNTNFCISGGGSWVPDVALSPKIELPTANPRFGSGRTGFSIPLWAEKDSGAWSVFGDGGRTLNPGAGNRDYSFGGIAVTRQVAENLLLGGELYHQTADAIDTRSSCGSAREADPRQILASPLFVMQK